MEVADAVEGVFEGVFGGAGEAAGGKDGGLVAVAACVADVGGGGRPVGSCRSTSGGPSARGEALPRTPRSQPLRSRHATGIGVWWRACQAALSPLTSLVDGPAAGAASVDSFLLRPVRFLRALAVLVPRRAARTAGSIL